MLFTSTHIQHKTLRTHLNSLKWAMKWGLEGGAVNIMLYKNKIRRHELHRHEQLKIVVNRAWNPRAVRQKRQKRQMAGWG